MTEVKRRPAGGDDGKEKPHESRGPRTESSASLVDEELAREVSRLLSGSEDDAS